MLRITDFCSCIFVFGCKLSLVRLCDSGFGITPVDDITIGITCTAFCFHIAHISFASSWYLFCLSVIVLARSCVFRTAVSIKKVFFVFLFIKIVGRLKVIVLSVCCYYYYYYYYYCCCCCYCRVHAVAQLGETLRYNRKAEGSFPDEVTVIFSFPSPYGGTMALAEAQPLTEMSTRCISWGVKAAGA